MAHRGEVELSETIELYLQLDNGRTGIPVTETLVSLRRANTDFYLDFGGGTPQFRTSGWTTREAQLTELSAGNSPGFYRLELDLSTISATDGPVVGEELIAEYEFDVTATPAFFLKRTDTWEVVDKAAEDAAVADAVWDEAKAGHVAAGSFGEEVQAHSLSSEVAAVQADTDDIQTRLPAALVGGRMDADVGNMQADTVTPAAVATDAIDADALAADAVAEIAAAIPDAAANADAVWDEATAGHVAAGSFGEEVQTHSTSAEVAAVQADTDDIQTRLPASLNAGRMRSHVEAMDADTVTASAIATDAIDADALASDAVAEIADGVWDELMTGHTLADSFGIGLIRSAYGGTVFVDANSGTSSTVVGSDGFRETPNDDIDTGVVVAEALGINHLHVLEGFARMGGLTSPPGFRNWKITGERRHYGNDGSGIPLDDTSQFYALDLFGFDTMQDMMIEDLPIASFFAFAIVGTIYWRRNIFRRCVIPYARDLLFGGAVAWPLWDLCEFHECEFATNAIPFPISDCILVDCFNVQDRAVSGGSTTETPNAHFNFNAHNKVHNWRGHFVIDPQDIAADSVIEFSGFDGVLTISAGTTAGSANTPAIIVEGKGFVIDNAGLPDGVLDISRLVPTDVAITARVAAGSTTTEIRTGLTQADDFFENMQVVIQNAAGTVVRNVDAYSNTNGAITVSTLPFTPAVGDFVYLVRRTGSVPTDTAAIADAVWDEAQADHLTPGSTGESLDAASMASSMDNFSVSQGWAFSTTLPTAGARVRATFELHRNGEFVALPGTARLAVTVYNRAGVGLFTQSDIAPNATGFFSLEEDPFTPTPGEVLTAVATITSSGVGTGTHVSALPIGSADVPST